MGRKAATEATKWQIIGMKGGFVISNREIERRLKISENCVRNILKTLKMTGGIQRHAGSGRLKKKLRSAKTVLYFVK